MKKIISILLITQIIFSLLPMSALAADEIIEFSAEDYSNMSGVQVLSSTTGKYLYCQAGNYLEYDISADTAGRFSLCLHAKSSKPSLVNVSVDGEMSANAEVKKNSYYQDVPCFVDLKQGQNKLKLFFASGSAYIDGVKLTKISGDKEREKQFLKDINEAADEDEIYNVLKTNGTYFGFDADSLIDGIWYKKAVFTPLKSRDYESLSDVFYDFIKNSATEKRSPSVTLQKGTTKIDDFQSGDLKLTYKSSRFKQGSSVFCALYETDASGRKKLFSLAGNIEISGAKLMAEFKGVEIADPKKISWQIVCFDDKEGIVPYDIFDNTYKNIYIATNGSDLNDGSKEKPFKTLSRAKEEIAKLAPDMTGDIVVNIAPGTYFLDETEEFTTAHSGKNGYNVIFKGTDEENPPVFSGGKRLTEWSHYKDGIYSAPLEATEVRNLYVNGIAQIRARSEFCFKYLEKYNDETDSTYDFDGIVTSDSGFKSLAYPEDAEMVWNLMWRSNRIPVQGIKEENNKKIVLINGRDWVAQEQSDNSVNLNNGKNYFIENAMEYLDNPGEFYYDKRQKLMFYYPFKAEDLENAEIVAPITENLFSIKGTSKTQKISNIVFDGIKVKYGAWNYASDRAIFNTQAGKCIDPLANDEEILLPAAQFEVNMAENIKIKNCEFSSLGSGAVSFTDGVSDCLFVGNIIKDVSGFAVDIGSLSHANSRISDAMEVCRNMKIENNLIRRVSTEYIQCPAITMYYGNAVKIKHNDISGTPYSGMSIGWGWEATSLWSDYSRNVDISYNKIENVLKQLKDGGPIYTLGHLYESRITNNYVRKNNDKAYGGIYLDAGSSYLNVYDNLVLDTYGYSFYVQSGYAAGNNHIYRNYSDRPEIRQSGSIDSNILEAVNEVSLSNLPDAAKEIKDNAGLEQEFSHLHSKYTEVPSYMNSTAKAFPKQVDEGGMVIEAESYGENYGNSLPRVKCYSNVVSFNGGQWLEYIVDVPKAGEYDVLVNGATNSYLTLQTSVNGGAYTTIGNFYATGTSYDDYKTQSFKSITLKEGMNILRIKNTNGAMHFDYFVLKYKN